MKKLLLQKLVQVHDTHHSTKYWVTLRSMAVVTSESKFLPIKSTLNHNDNRETLLYQESLYCGQSDNTPDSRPFYSKDNNRCSFNFIAFEANSKSLFPNGFSKNTH